MSDVPPEIIVSILILLPVKSLLRFRCVSKQWRSSIDGQDFVKLHLQQSAETNSNRTLVVKSTKLFYIDLDSFKQLDAGIIRFEPRYVAASCNGLVLLVSDSEDLVLWNPSTRKLNELPKSFGVSLGKGRYGMGYASKHDDYKIVRVVLAPDWDVTIYSLKSNSWKKLNDFRYTLIQDKTWGAHVNGALHTGFEGEWITAFDLENEKNYMVPTPINFSDRIMSVEVLGGCLAAVVYGKNYSREIWVMKEYMVKGSWCELLCFYEPCLDLYPLAYSKSGDEVLLNYKGLCLSWYNLRNTAVTIACVEGLSPTFDAMSRYPLLEARFCVGSLVSPYSRGGATLLKKQDAGQGQKEKEIKKKRDDFLSVGLKLKL